MGVTCSRCRHDNPAETRFCGNCAAPLDPSLLPTQTYQAPVRELTTGSVFAGRFQVIEELGHGGMGRVYKVLDTELNEKIALKLLRPELAADTEAVERFRHELKSARQVAHKNVCRMFDIGRAEGTPYITMEYVPGEDLKRLIRKIGLMPAGRAVSIARQIVEGLAEAHGRGIVHRDLKPQNIMVDEGGSVHIMDFGIARSLEKKGLTGAGVMIGTPEYMSPEQVEGKPVDARSDLYALGVIIYEMTTGRVPFEGETAFTIGVKHKSEPPVDPRTHNPAIPADLARLILRCLEKDKDGRFESAAALGAELGRIEQALPTTERIAPETRPRTSKQVTVTINVRKAALPVLAGALTVVAVLVLFLVVLKKPIAVASSGRPLLAVLYFRNNTGDPALDEWRTALPALVIADLYQSRYIDVASDSQMYGVLKELGLKDAEAYAPEDLRRVAEKTRATQLLQGTLTRAGTSFRINTTLEDAATGKVISAEMVQGEGEASFHIMVDELGRKIKAGLRLTSGEIASDVDRDVGKITSASPEAYKLYAQARIYHNAQDYKSSIALLEKAVAIDPGFAMAYRSMSTAYANMGFRAKAEECRRKAMDLADRISDRERWLVEGSYYWRSEATYDKAIAAFQKVLALYPDDPVANNGIGVVHGYIDEPEKAVEPFERIVARPGAPYLNYGNLAGVYARLGRYDDARKLLEGYLAKTPDSAAAHDGLASVYIYEGRYELARAEAEKAFALAPRDMGIIETAGDIAMLEGDFSRAEAEYGKVAAMAIEAKMPWRRRPLACLYLAQGRYGRALEELAMVMDEARKVGEPGWLGPFNFFATLVYGAAGRFAEALEAAEQSDRVAEAAGNINMARFALWSKGAALVGLKDLDGAQKAADAGRELVEKYFNKRAIRGLLSLQAQIDLAKGNVAGAVENAKAAVGLLEPQSASSNPDAYYYATLAAAYEAAGDLESARKTCEAVQRLTSGRIYGGQVYALSFYRIGLIDEKLGDKAAARRSYEKFLELWKDADPGLPQPADARKRLAER